MRIIVLNKFLFFLFWLFFVFFLVPVFLEKNNYWYKTEFFFVILPAVEDLETIPVLGHMHVFSLTARSTAS